MNQKILIILSLFVIGFFFLRCREESTYKNEAFFQELNSSLDKDDIQKNDDRFKKNIITPSLENPKYKKVYNLIKKVVKHIKQDGAEKIIKQINEEKKYWKGEYYVFILKPFYEKGIIKKIITLAHPVNSALRGKDVLPLKDVDGFPFIKTQVEIAKKKGKGWIRYKWSHPKLKKLAVKDTYFEKINGYVVACGIYP